MAGRRQVVENPGIEIRGSRYPFPTLDTVTLAEERVLFVYADCVVRDFIPAHPDATDEEKAAYGQLQLRKIRNPDFKRSLAYIAYKRSHPDFEDADVWKAAGEANALEADIAMLWGDGPSPPATTSQKQPENARSTSEPSTSTDSGRSTTNGSGHQDESPTPTGTSGSDTSSPGARPTASVS
jgi:hypothetical protein